VATAYHEAGHVVAAWRFDFEIESATIEPTPERGSLGHMQLSASLKHNPSERIDEWERDVLIDRRVIHYFAGVAAENAYRKRGRRAPLSGASGDLHDIVAGCPIRWSPETERAHWKYCWHRACDLVNERLHWAMIRAVAKELLRRRTLTGDECGTIIRRAADDEGKRRPSRRGKGR